LPNPKGTDTGNEWIELYSCGDNDLNLSNWYLQDKSGKTHPLQDANIESNGFLIIYPDFSLNQSDEEIFLFDDTGNLVDQFTYSSSKEGITWSREFDGIGEWTDSLEPTPGKSNEIDYPDQIRINEIYPSPDKSIERIEWIELHNYSAEEIQLDNWQISDLTKTHELVDLSIKAQGYLLLTQEDLGITLNNSGDSISLINPNQKVVSNFEYGPTSTGISNIYYKGKFEQSQVATPSQENEYVSIDDHFYNLDFLEIEKFKELSTETQELYGLDGVVTAQTDQIYKNKLYIQDKSGGIMVSLPDGIKDYKVGDKIHVCGTRSTYYKEDNIKVPDQNCVKKVGTEAVQAENINEAENLIGLVGQLVSLTGVVVEKTSSSFYIETPDGEIKVASNTKVEIDDFIEITGILTRRGDLPDGEANIRVIPRDQSDVILLSANESEQSNQTWKPGILGQGEFVDLGMGTDISLAIPGIFPLDKITSSQALQNITEKENIHNIIGGSGFLSSVSSIVLLFKKKL